MKTFNTQTDERRWVHQGERQTGLGLIPHIAWTWARAPPSGANSIFCNIQTLAVPIPGACSTLSQASVVLSPCSHLIGDLLPCQTLRSARVHSRSLPVGDRALLYDTTRAGTLCRFIESTEVWSAGDGSWQLLTHSLPYMVAHFREEAKRVGEHTHSLPTNVENCSFLCFALTSLQEHVPGVGDFQSTLSTTPS